MREAEAMREGFGILKGWHVLASLIVFFGTIFAVNGYFVYAAVSSYTGIVSAEPYRKGLAYNERIAAGERQAALGWQEDVIVERGGLVRVIIRDADGNPVPYLKLAGTIGRPSTIRFDRRLALTERAPGRYEAEAGVLDAGAWLVGVEARRTADDGEPTYRARRRLWLKP